MQKKKESKATVKKTVLWTVFRESADASFLSYLCATSVVGTFARLIVFCPCQNESTSFDVLFILQKKKESKATVKKTVLWTVFR
ncbi:hypothetical protein ACTQ2N_06435, partial [Ruminococcus sp. LCP21S3_E8]